MTIHLLPLCNALGAEVIGVDVSQHVDGETFEEIYKAWLQHNILLFRGQSITIPQQIAFATRFGALEFPGAAINVHPEHPEILVFSNIKVDGKPVDKKGASPKASLLFQSAKAALKATMSKRGDGFADNVETTAGGLALAIYSSKADKFDTPKMAKKYMHLNIKFDQGLPKGANGVFTELAGNKVLSEATRALLMPPRSALSPHRIKKDGAGAFLVK